MDTETNWALIGQAIEHYKDLGYEYVELPWTVPMDVMTSTCDESMVINSDIGPLVGSAEQSFLAADLRCTLGKGKFISCTPCFRLDRIDELHSAAFMKVELYQNVDVNEESLSNMVELAHDFFRREQLIPWPWPAIVSTPEGFDIEVNGIEVGSYGIREFENIKWVYGTGLAEPRFSKALQMGNI